MGRTNKAIADEGERIMDLMREMTGVDHDDDQDGPETALGDLLAHLMHWCDVRGVDFDIAVERGRGHWQAEVEEEAEASA